MQADIAAAAPAIDEPRRLEGVLARLSLPAAVSLTLMLELALAERKFAIFGGGFGQSRAIDTPFETIAFLAALVAAHALLFSLFYRLVRRLHGRRDTLLVHFNAFYVSTFIASAILLAKYQALSYFGDALSFQLVRNLGGGSIVQALGYVASEGALILIVAAGAAGVYLLLRFALKRWLRAAEPLPRRYGPSGRSLLAALVATPLLLLAALQITDVRSALGRFNAPYAITALFDRLTDFDRDGAGLFAYPADPFPFDASRYPFALDIPNNGIDEDGFAGDLILADASPAPAPPVRIAGERPHVVLVMLESTRGDVIGRRFRGRPVAPNLEALAANGTYVPAAFSHAGFTSFSLKTLFTGRLVPEGPAGSLFETFRANGYRTAALSSQAEDFGDIAETVGMRGSDIYVDAKTQREERVYGLGSESSLKIDDRVLLREFDRHLGRADAWTRPNFVYFNLQAAHFPYDHPGMPRPLGIEPLPRGDIAPANRERLAETYWNAVAANDQILGEIVARLRRLGIWDDTLLVVTADHGESLFEDGFLGHGHMINRRQNHIPFVMNRRVAVAAPVGLADVRGIVLRAAGGDVPSQAGATPGRVFQYIGSLDRPSSIGFADARGNFTIFSFDREALWTAATGRWSDYGSLPPGSAARAEADGLIREWGRQRWLNRAGG